jgi:hypothetical protein
MTLKMWSVGIPLLTILSAALNLRLMRQKHPLARMIEEKRAAIAKIERNLERLKIEVATLEKARAAMADTPAKPNRMRAAAKANGDATAERRRGRSISAPWKRVLAEIGLAGQDGASIDYIADVCEQNGIQIKRPTLRAQMTNYVHKQGYLSRPTKGVFVLTPKGAKIAGVKMDTGDGRETAEAPR